MLQKQIREDLTAAMKQKDELRLTVLRGLVSACTQELTATKRTPQDELTDDEVLTVIRRGIKQRADASEQFRAGGRPELAEKEDAEAEILQAYLPQMMSQEEIEPVAKVKIAELGATSKADAGRVMGAVMAALKGKADGKDVKEVVERFLS